MDHAGGHFAEHRQLAGLGELMVLFGQRPRIFLKFVSRPHNPADENKPEDTQQQKPQSRPGKNFGK
jgi:hypothetical protein